MARPGAQRYRLAGFGYLGPVDQSAKTVTDGKAPGSSLTALAAAFVLAGLAYLIGSPTG